MKAMLRVVDTLAQDPEYKFSDWAAPKWSKGQGVRPAFCLTSSRWFPVGKTPQLRRWSHGASTHSSQGFQGNATLAALLGHVTWSFLLEDGG